MNSIGNKICFTSFGTSHGDCIGGVLDGMPAGIRIDMDKINEALARRRGEALPQQLKIGISQRAQKETDEIKWLSGFTNNTTTGAPIAFIIANSQQQPKDYDNIANMFRPAHADYTYYMKYGNLEQGGGRSSARETATRVVAGSIVMQWLQTKNIEIRAKILQIGNATEINDIHNLLLNLQKQGNSIGGIIGCEISGLPIGIGEPIFNKLPACLAKAMLSINGCKGFDYGSGFADVGLTGKELNDQMPYITNHAGGCLGGISNGQTLYFRCVFKPTPSISVPQQTINTAGENITIQIKGRHDTCFALRTPVIVESMAAIAIAQFFA